MPCQVQSLQDPTQDEAAQVCQAFHHMLQTLEKTLNSQRAQHAQQRRQEDPAVIFRDRSQSGSSAASANVSG